MLSLLIHIFPSSFFGLRPYLWDLNMCVFVFNIFSIRKLYFLSRLKPFNPFLGGKAEPPRTTFVDQVSLTGKCFQ